MTCLVAIPNDPVSAYLKKGEIKAGYFNPGRLFDRVHLISLTDQDVPAKDVLELAGGAELSIHSLGWPRIFDLPFFLGRASRFIASLQPDLIRAHNPWLAGCLAVWAGRKLGLPSLIYLHIENDQRRRFDKTWRFKLVKPLERYTLSRASAVVAVSGFVAEYAKRYGAKRVETIYNKVFCQQFVPPWPKGFHQPIRLLYVGRLDPQKAPEVIIEAVAGLEVELTIIGQGQERPRLESLARRLGVRVEFIPAVPHPRIQEHYHQADIFVLATRYEGFCIPVLEAMAAGLPVVASQTPPIPEILGETGLLVPNCPQAFREALLKLMAAPDFALALGRQARQRALSLDGGIMEAKEVALYQELLAQKR